MPAVALLLLIGCGSGVVGTGETTGEITPTDSQPIINDGTSDDAGPKRGVLDSGAPSPELVCDKGIYEGSYQIRGEDARSQLAALSGYTAVTRSLRIVDTRDLKTLAGLECLEKVGRTLRIARNRALTSLDALERLVSAEKIYVEKNPAIDECHAFEWAVRQGFTDQKCSTAAGAQSEPSSPDSKRVDRPDPFARMVEELEEPKPPFGDRILARALPRAVKRIYQKKSKGGDDGDDGHYDDFELIGAYLDAAHSRYLVLIHHNLADNYLVLTNAEGRFLSKAKVKGRGVEVGLLDVIGDDTVEVFVSVIEGSGMSVYPVSWHLFEAAGKKLHRIARIAKDHSTPQYDKKCKGSGSGTETRLYSFVNEISFPAKDRMVVETVIYTGDSFEGLAPPKGYPKGLGEVSEFAYHPAEHKFARTGFKRGKTHDELQAEAAAAADAESETHRGVIFHFEAYTLDPCDDPLGPDYVL